MQYVVNIDLFGPFGQGKAPFGPANRANQFFSFQYKQNLGQVGRRNIFFGRYFGGGNLHAAMGGLHLSGAAVEKIIPETVADLDRFALTQIVPAHCTGWRAVGALVERFGEDRVSPSAVGRRYNF